MLYWSITKLLWENRHVLVIPDLALVTSSIQILLMANLPFLIYISLKHCPGYTHVCKASEMAGATAMVGEMEKNCKHEDSVLKCGVQFFPLVVGSLSLSFWTPTSLQTVRTMQPKLQLITVIVYSKHFQTSYSTSVRLWPEL